MRIINTDFCFLSDIPTYKLKSLFREGQDKGAKEIKEYTHTHTHTHVIYYLSVCDKTPWLSQFKVKFQDEFILI